MTRYAEQLLALHQATIDRVAAEGLTPSANLAVYAQGYSARLQSAMMADYPALAQYVGTPAMQQAVDAFVRETPSMHWDLNLYPIGFAAFACTHFTSPAAQAIAQLEGAIADVFWLPDSEPASAAELQRLGEHIATYPLRLRTASRVLALTHPADDYLRAFRAGTPLTDFDPSPQYLLVIRLKNEVVRMVLAPEEYQLLRLLNEGMSLADATAQMPDHEILAAQLPQFLQRWCAAGIFRAPT